MTVANKDTLLVPLPCNPFLYSRNVYQV